MNIIWNMGIRANSEVRADFEKWLDEQKNICMQQAIAAHNMETLSLAKGKLQAFDLIQQMLNKPEIEESHGGAS